MNDNNELSIQIKTLLEEFLNYFSQSKNKPSKNTIKNYKADINQFIQFVEEEFKTQFSPHFVTPQILEIYIKAKSSNTEKSISSKSLKRHLSSLRKFFHFLKAKDLISLTPSEVINSINWSANQLSVMTGGAVSHKKIKDFKVYLCEQNKSHLTIKNYISDLLLFFNWMEKVANIDLNAINEIVVEEYKKRLLEKGAAFSSINRKLSSIRKYLGWALEKGLVKSEIKIFDVRNEKIDSETLILEPQNIKIDQTIINASEVSYLPPQEVKNEHLSFPPLRLLQKTKLFAGFIFDRTIIHFLSETIEHLDYELWRLRGKPIFRRKTLSNTQKNAKANLNRSLDQRISAIPKSFYAPLLISTAGFAIHKKVWHTLRHKRPEWYKKYHSISVTHHLHVAVLFMCMIFWGIYLYSTFMPNETGKKEVLANYASSKFLSFKGRLSDKEGIPMSVPRSVRFTIYNSPHASGSSLLWQEVNTVNPNKDGEFSVLLGNTTANGTPLSHTLFSENPSLWIGITIENEDESIPRTQLPTVTLASDSEFLDGLSPITRPNSGTSNVVLSLDSSGNLTIGGKSDHTFQTTGGKFTLSGQVLLLTTNSGSSSNIEVIPDGLGKVDIQKPIINSIGKVDINDTVNILATSSAEPALLINQDSIGPLVIASTSGVTKFAIDNDGNGFFAGNIGIGTQSAQSPLDIRKDTSGNVLSIFTKVASQSGGQAYATFGDTDSIERFKVGLNAASYSSTRIGFDFVESQSGKSLLSILQDGTIGIGTSSPSDARLVILNNNLSSGNAIKAISSLSDFPSANFSSSIYNTQALLGGQHAALFTGGNVGIGNTSPVAALDITSTLTDAPAASISANTSSIALIVDNKGSGDLFTASSSGLSRFVIKQDGNVGIGVSTPSYRLQLSEDSAAKPGTNTWTVPSDIRLKNILGSYTYGLSEITRLNTIKYSFKEDNALGIKDRKEYIGIIAQEVQSIIPEAITTGPDGYLRFSADPVIWASINAIKELDQKVKNINIDSNGDIIITNANSSNTIPDSPEIFEAKSEQLRTNSYHVKLKTDEIITNIGGFAKLFVGTLKAGFVEAENVIINNTLLAKSVITETLTANQKVISPLAEIDQIHVGIISPLASNSDVVVKLGSESAVQSSKFKVQSSEGKDIASIDAQGNAYFAKDIEAREGTFSGQLSSVGLNTNDATIAGTLRAQSIIANNIEGLQTQISTIAAGLINTFNFMDISSFSAQLTDGLSLNASTGIFTEGLIALGPSSFNDIAIAGQLSIGSPVGGLILASNTINILGGSDLEIQSLRQGGISFMRGSIYIDTDGNLQANGNADFAKDVRVGGVLSTNIISPLPDSDFIIKQATNSSVVIKNSSEESIVAIDQSGNVLASGSGTFTDLFAKTFNIVRSVQADTSLTETISTSSAGTATIIEGETERTIITPYVLENSLIYITPTSDTQGITPYVARQTTTIQPNEDENLPSGRHGSFTIKIPQRTYQNISVNWWIIN